MFISHLVLLLVPKLSPDAPTTCGMQLLSRFLMPSLWYISKEITLFMAPVSKSVLILRSGFLLAKIGNIVPLVGPSSSTL